MEYKWIGFPRKIFYVKNSQAEMKGRESLNHVVILLRKWLKDGSVASPRVYLMISPPWEFLLSQLNVEAWSPVSAQSIWGEFICIFCVQRWYKMQSVLNDAEDIILLWKQRLSLSSDNQIGEHLCLIPLLATPVAVRWIYIEMYKKRIDMAIIRAVKNSLNMNTILAVSWYNHVRLCCRNFGSRSLSFEFSSI